jgi:hypothetical protein
MAQPLLYPAFALTLCAGIDARLPSGNPCRLTPTVHQGGPPDGRVSVTATFGPCLTK